MNVFYWLAGIFAIIVVILITMPLYRSLRLGQLVYETTCASKKFEVYGKAHDANEAGFSLVTTTIRFDGKEVLIGPYPYLDTSSSTIFTITPKDAAYDLLPEGSDYPFGFRAIRTGLNLYLPAESFSRSDYETLAQCLAPKAQDITITLADTSIGSSLAPGKTYRPNLFSLTYDSPISKIFRSKELDAYERGSPEKLSLSVSNDGAIKLFFEKDQNGSLFGIIVRDTNEKNSIEMNPSYFTGGKSPKSLLQNFTLEDWKSVLQTVKDDEGNSLMTQYNIGNVIAGDNAHLPNGGETRWWYVNP